MLYLVEIDCHSESFMTSFSGKSLVNVATWAHGNRSVHEYVVNKCVLFSLDWNVHRTLIPSSALSSFCARLSLVLVNFKKNHSFLRILCCNRLPYFLTFVHFYFILFIYLSCLL